MSQFVVTPTRTFLSGAAIAAFVRVKLVAGVLQVAGANDDWIGVTEEACFAANVPLAVRLRTAQGTDKFTAGGAIASGVRVYGAANGKIDDAITTEYIGLSLEAASADGDIIEVLRLPGSAFRMMRGMATTVTASDTIVTGLNTVVAAVASLEDNDALGLDYAQAVVGDQAGTPAAGSILLKTWKATASGDCTPTAATVFGKKVSWIAFGT